MADGGTDERAYLAGLLGGGSASGADGPHRLISDDAFAQFFGTDASQSGFDLQGNQIHGHAQLALFQALTDADDGMKAGLQSGVHLFIYGDVGLAEILAAFAVADDDVLHAQVLEHVGRDFTGICAVFFIKYILGAYRYAHIFECAQRGGDVDRGNANQHIAPFGAGQDGFQFIGKLFGLGSGFVHFPVSGYDCFSVSAVHVLLSPCS